MKWFRTLSVAGLLAASLWPHVEAQIPTHSLPTALSPNKTVPANVAAPNAGTGPPFAVVEDKRREIPSDLAIADALSTTPLDLLDGIACMDVVCFCKHLVFKALREVA